MGKVLAAYGGGFKPPTAGHFLVVKKALEENPEIDELTGRLTELAGPVIIVIIGGIIGTVMIAMYLPVFMSAGNM